MRQPEQELDALREQSLLRSLRQLDGPQDTTMSWHGEQLVNFASNDYLGLAQHPALKAAFIQGIEKFGTGSGASRLVTGNLPAHRQLEETIAELKNTEAAISFANGYNCSVGTLTALLQKGDTVILDKLSHASLIDGARMSGATVRVFPHNHLAKLEKLLKSVTSNASSQPAGARTLIVTESVFSMDGDIAPLAEICALKEKYGALLLVDEAHGLGVFGSTGMGLAEQLDLTSQIDFHMGTLGKAAGVAGGYIACSASYRQLLINRARSFIYSTAPPPAQAYAAAAALRLISSNEGREMREKLWLNIHQLASQLDHSITPTSAIIPWMIGDTDSAIQLSENLQQNGLLVPAIRYPTVPKNTARLRITISASHTPAQLSQLAQALTSSS